MTNYNLLNQDEVKKEGETMADKHIKKPKGKGWYEIPPFYYHRTKPGISYKCKYCGKKTIGIRFDGVGMHTKKCEHYREGADWTPRP